MIIHKMNLFEADGKQVSKEAMPHVAAYLKGGSCVYSKLLKYVDICSEVHIFKRMGTYLDTVAFVAPDAPEWVEPAVIELFGDDRNI